MILFETDKKPLTFLLDRIQNCDLALPDFQRSFVWDPNSTRELVVSVIRSFPAGTLLQMEGGGKVFAPRAFEGAPDLNGRPSHLILDGQQRMTSLYQAFSGVGSHRFFLNVQELLDGQDLDEAVEVYNVRRAARWSKLEKQAVDLMLPLAAVRAFSDWRDDVLDHLEGGELEIKKLRRQLNEIENEYVDPIKYYNFPVTTLSSSTPVEAVCTIFETLNRTGVKLSVFELITARAFAHDVRLRELWEEAKDEKSMLIDFGINPYYILQIIAVNVKKSPQRSVVLGLDVRDIVEHWDEAVDGLAGTLGLLRDECGVLVGKWIPYETMLITMGSAWRSIRGARGAAVGAMRAKMARWFWCSAFAQSYDNSGNTMTERDEPELRRWLEGGAEPEVVASFRFDSNRWRETTVRQRALYRATMALLMSRSPRDFHKAIPLSKSTIDGQAVDDHHIFPRKYLASKVRAKTIDNVLNHTLIDRATNVRIGGRAPSDYLGEIEKELGPNLAKILSSHGLPPGRRDPLFENRFEDFLDWRQSHLEKELAETTGGEVGASLAPMEIDARRRGPFLKSDTSEMSENSEDVDSLLNQFCPPEDRPLVDRFIQEVSSWPGVATHAGQSKYLDRRRVFFSRKGSPLGAFCWLRPRLSRVRLRLDAEDRDSQSLAQALDRKDPYRLRMTLRGEPELEEAIKLARHAYEQAVP